MRTCTGHRTRPRASNSIARILNRWGRRHDICPPRQQRRPSRVASVLNRRRRRHNSRANGIGPLGSPLSESGSQLRRRSNRRIMRQRRPPSCLPSCGLIHLRRWRHYPGRPSRRVPPQVRCDREWHRRRNRIRAWQIRRLGRGLPDVRRRHDFGFLLRRHWHRRLAGSLWCMLPSRQNTRRSALGRSKRPLRWIISNRRVQRSSLRKQFDRRPNPGLTPHKQNHHQQMQ